MSNAVDPFIQPIPDKFLNDPDPEVRAYYEYQNRFLHDLWVRTGGGIDLIDQALNDGNEFDGQNAYLRGLVSELRRKVSQLEANQQTNIKPALTFKDFNPQTITKSYTSGDKDWLEVKTNQVIKLDKYPPKNASIVVVNGNDFTVTVDGNGKKINGADKVRSTQKYTTMVFNYFEPSDTWYMTIQTVEDVEHKRAVENELQRIAKTAETLAAMINEIHDLGLNVGEIEEK